MTDDAEKPAPVVEKVTCLVGTNKRDRQSFRDYQQGQPATPSWAERAVFNHLLPDRLANLSDAELVGLGDRREFPKASKVKINGVEMLMWVRTQIRDVVDSRGREGLEALAATNFIVEPVNPDIRPPGRKRRYQSRDPITLRRAPDDTDNHDNDDKDLK